MKHPSFRQDMAEWSAATWDFHRRVPMGKLEAVEKSRLRRRGEQLPSGPELHSAVSRPAHADELPGMGAWWKPVNCTGMPLDFPWWVLEAEAMLNGEHTADRSRGADSGVSPAPAADRRRDRASVADIV